MPAASDRFVYLRGGLTVPIEPLLLIFELQERGFDLTLEGTDTLNVQPYQRLTAEDCKQIKFWKRHILAILSYEAPDGAKVLT